HSQFPLLRRHPGGGIVGRYDSAGDSDLPGVGGFQTGDATKQSGFSGAAGVDDNEQLAFGDFQVERFDRGNRAVANDETFMQTADGNHRVYGSIGPALFL